MLEINTTVNEDILVIELEGVLDSRTSSDFKSWFEERMLEGYRDFILDFLSLEYLSSRGIGVITEIQQFLQSKGGRVAICHTSEEVKRLLTFLKIDQIIKVCSGVKHAVAEISKMKRGTMPDSAEKEGLRQQIEISETDLLDQKEPVASGSKKVSDMVEQSQEHMANTQENMANTQENTQEHMANTQENMANTQEVKKSGTIPDNGTTRISNTNARIIYCQNCGRRLRVSKPGKYLCPSCKLSFYYNLDN